MKLSPTPRMRRAALALAVGSAVAIPGSVATAAVVVYGNPGPNTLRVTDPAGGTVYGDGGGDTIFGNAGPDQLYGETGPDRIMGSGGDDFLDGDSADDTLDGGVGNDKIRGGLGHDTITAGDGNDEIDGGAAPDTIDGGTGNDVISGGGASDKIDGGDGDDQLFTSGPDEVSGGAGNDVVHGNTDVSGVVRSIDCGAGNDTLILPSNGKAAGPMRFKLQQGVYKNCENVLEQPQFVDPTRGITVNVDTFSNASIAGTDRDDTLNGAHGSNKINGLGGADQIYTDSKKVTPGSSTEHRAKKQRDTADGGAGDDFIIGGTGTNVLRGGAGDDSLRGGNAANTVYGEDGNDKIRVAGKGRTRIFGGAGDDEIVVATKRKAVIDCGPGNDTVRIGRVRPKLVGNSCERQLSSYRK